MTLQKCYKALNKFVVIVGFIALIAMTAGAVSNTQTANVDKIPTTQFHRGGLK